MGGETRVSERLQANAYNLIFAFISYQISKYSDLFSIPLYGCMDSSCSATSLWANRLMNANTTSWKDPFEHLQTHVLDFSSSSPPSYYEELYEVKGEVGIDSINHCNPSALHEAQYYQMTESGLAAPYRRRGGLVDHRDVIKAHEAHKMHSTPQAKRKEWE
ncbi:hypothetical protein chiPu_0013178 [Chiloscyllium punctatum]|uniref:Uncharacterized protein n=1 Tax=Chiloscyllium punctatum TaxID=137246 RepID=A0A401SWE7_CHIPU|nr:hypothetical protein [Chiloscyllium punctatum]